MVIPCGFKSHSSHQQADVAELADALDSGSSGSNTVQVQVLLSAPSRKASDPGAFFVLCRWFPTEAGWGISTVLGREQIGRAHV